MPIPSGSARTLVVGDIHGCFAELLRLLHLAALGPDDLLVSVGDLVDRGPASLEVVRFFAADPLRRRAVRGNHEVKHLRHDRPDPGDPSGRITRRTMTAAQYEETLAFLATLPLWLDLPEALVVHAGVLPGLPLEEQPERVLTGRGSQRREGFDGRTPWWFDDPALDWPKPIVFGHHRFPEVARGRRGNVWGLNTSAAEGGHLTGLVLPAFELLLIPTPDHWHTARERWRPVFLAEDLPEMPWRDVLALDPSAWPADTAGTVAAAQAAYAGALGRLRDEVAELRRATGYDAHEGEARGELRRHVLAAADAAGTWRQLLARCFPGGQEAELLARELPTPRALHAALP